MAGPTTLLLDALFLVVIASVYWQVGRVTFRRKVDGDGQLASKLFGVWWYALAGIQAVSAVTRALAYADVLDVTLYVTITYVLVLGICTAFWGLVYYLSFLLTGDRRVLMPLTAFYIAYYAFLLYYLTLRDPVDIAVTAWNVKIVYAREIAGAPRALVVLLLIVPPLAGAIGYTRLYFKVRDPTQRYRIGLVSVTLVSWFAILLVAWAVEAGEHPWWQLVSRSMGLVSALLVYAAYRPPGWIRKRWGVAAVEDASAG